MVDGSIVGCNATPMRRAGRGCFDQRHGLPWGGATVARAGVTLLPWRVAECGGGPANKGPAGEKRLAPPTIRCER